MKCETMNLYGDRPDVTLTTYLIDDSPEMLGGKKRPAILICPGGGYFNCSDREAEPIALRFAGMGWSAFVLRYSVYFEGKAPTLDFSKSLEPNEKTKYPAPVLEIGMAMRIIRDHADEWLIDQDRIALCGFSAGGHNAAMFATKWHTCMITDALGGTPEQYHPAALILGYALTDMSWMEERHADLGPLGGFYDAMNQAYYGVTRPVPDLLKETSPALNVTEHMPPTFLWATAADGLVPVQQTIRMANALADHKIPFEMHIFEEGDHGLALCDQSTSQAKSQMNADAAKWVPLAGAWLEKRIALDLPDLTPFELMMAEQK